MNENSDLKERLKSELETPEVPFEEWAQKRRVFEELDECNAVTYPVTELADNVSGKGISGGNKKRIIIGSSIIAFIVAVAVILGIFLPRTSNIDITEIFGANDALTVDTELEEVLAVEESYLFDMSAVLQVSGITKDVLKQDNSQVLLYSINNCLIYIEEEDEFDAFYLTYQIRVYPNYEFYNLDNYSKLNDSSTINNFNVRYSLVENNEACGYARFKNNNYEYFIEARGFTGVTVLTEDNFINLLNKILI